MADYKQLATQKISELPIAKHLTNITSEINGNGKQWRKGEKTFFGLLLGVALLIGGGLFVLFAYKLLIGYLLPIVGIMAQYIVVGSVLVMGWLSRNAIYNKFKSWSRSLSKKFIADDPFGELDNQLVIMTKSKEGFVESKGKVNQLKNKMKEDAQKWADDAENWSQKVELFHKRALEVKAKIEELKPLQVEGDESYDYIQLLNERDTLVADGNRAVSMYTQSNAFAIKYGDRGSMLSKLDKKLSRVSTQINIKVEDFRQTIKQLRDEYDVAYNLRAVTDAAKGALMFDTRWEVEFAMDLITTSISRDLAAAASNLNDIDMATGALLSGVDDDAAFAKLEKLSLKISSGEEKVVNVDKYNKPNYKRTEEDAKANPSFGDFNF